MGHSWHILSNEIYGMFFLRPKGTRWLSRGSLNLMKPGARTSAAVRNMKSSRTLVAQQISSVHTWQQLSLSATSTSVTSCYKPAVHFFSKTSVKWAYQLQSQLMDFRVHSWNRFQVFLFSSGKTQLSSSARMCRNLELHPFLLPVSEGA